MTGFLFVLGLCALPVIGYGFVSLPSFRSLHPASRIGLAGCFGALTLCGEMLLLTSLHVPWSVWLLLCPAVLGIFSLPEFRARARGAEWSLRDGAPALVLTVLILSAAVYAAGSARATSTDLLFFWGTKGQRFAQTRSIDAAFLGDPAHLLMHPDYPPMLPCLYAWATLLAGQFAWGAALLSLPVFLALAVLTFFGFARATLGQREAMEHACLLAAVLTLVMVAGYTAGNAEPLLVYFEVTALSALVFAADRPEGIPVAAVALAGAALTKVEGVVFAALVAGGAVLFFRDARHWRRLALLAGAPAAALGAWSLFCRSHRLPDVFDLHKPSTPTLAHFSLVIGDVIHQASYGFWFAPWVVLFLLALPGRRTRPSLLALTVALGFGAFLLYAYLTSSGNPHLWIEWSASRVLITPLVCLFFCATARSGAANAPADGAGIADISLPS
jgi:hypothetical protein